MNMKANEGSELSWSALEYEEKERSRDWFWALGIIVITSSVASIIFGNYFFAALLIISGFLLGFFAVKKPEMIEYKLQNKGLKIENRLYPYENILSFWVQTPGTSLTPQPVTKSILFVKSNRAFMPILSIPIEEWMAEEIHSLLLSKNIKEEEMREHPSEKIMDALGF